MLFHPDPRCAACRHHVDGCCEPAAEALRRMGYPAMTIRPDQASEARFCPDFSLSRQAREEGEGEGARARWRRTASLAKGHRPG